VGTSFALGKLAACKASDAAKSREIAEAALQRAQAKKILLPGPISKALTALAAAGA
jgi:hypothetical protein